MKIKFFLCVLLFLFISCTEETEKNLKNVIVMISDGCGYNQIDATSLYQYGETGVQEYEQFPTKLAMTTYPGNGDGYDPDVFWEDFDYGITNYTDSAAAATAMSSGTKTYKYAIGVDMNKDELVTMTEYMKKKGKSTGVVTSVEWSHATPAGFAAHNESRSNYSDIAIEMIYESKLDVIMGCGHPLYDNDGEAAAEPDYKYVGGLDTWNEIIGNTAGSDIDEDGEIDYWQIIQDKDEFQALMIGDSPSRVIGIPKVYETLQYERKDEGQASPYEQAFNNNMPTLAEMSIAAINVIDDNPKGFFLMIEGGAIDWAGHDNKAYRLIEEEIDFNDAVEAVIEWIEANGGWDENLLVVTADHETGYLTGPDSGDGPVWNPLINNGKESLPGLEWHSGNHTNSLVPFFVNGNGSEIFEDMIDGNDPVRGDYIDNTDIRNVVEEIFGE